MITPVEIENKEFSKSLRGYDEVEVDEFLDKIIVDLEQLLVGMSRLKRENEELRAENEQHRESQKSVMHTLDSAKRLMKDISESAEKRADIIIRNAKLDADMIRKDAEDSVTKFNDERTVIREKILSLRERYKQFLMDELAVADHKGTDILEILEEDFMPASLDRMLEDNVLNDESAEDDVSDKTEHEVLTSEHDDSDVDQELEAEDIFSAKNDKIFTANAARETVAISKSQMSDLLAQLEEEANNPGKKGR